MSMSVGQFQDQIQDLRLDRHIQALWSAHPPTAAADCAARAMAIITRWRMPPEN